MDDNTIINLIEVLGDALKAHASGQKIDIETTRTAFREAVQQAASPLFKASNYDLKETVKKAIAEEIGGRH